MQVPNMRRCGDAPSCLTCSFPRHSSCAGAVSCCVTNNLEVQQRLLHQNNPPWKPLGSTEGYLGLSQGHGSSMPKDAAINSLEINGGLKAMYIDEINITTKITRVLSNDN